MNINISGEGQNRRPEVETSGDAKLNIETSTSDNGSVEISASGSFEQQRAKDRKETKEKKPKKAKQANRNEQPILFSTLSV